MSNPPVFGAGIWHFATYLDRYATEGYGPPVGLLEQIDKAGAVGDLSVVDLNWPFAGFDGTLDDVKAALQRNGLRAVAILDGVATWNEFLFALILLNSDASKTIPVGLLNFTGQFANNNTGLAAGIFIAVIPILIAYIFLQRWIVGGLTAGASKG